LLYLFYDSGVNPHPADVFAMIVRVLALILVLSSMCLYAQTKPRRSQPRKPVNPQAAAAPVDDKLSRHLSAAETYQIAGDLDRAAVENRAVAAIALQRIGALYLEEGNYAKAAKYFSDSAALADNALTRASLAVAYLRMAETEKALTEARAAVDLDPKEVRARQILGSLYYSKGDYQAALPELEKVLQLAPDFDGAYLLGMTYLHLRQLERARLLFEEMQQAVTKKSADLHMLLGRAYEETDYPKEAEREYKRAAQLDPRQRGAHFFLGYVILQHGGGERLEEAGQAFEREIALNPRDFYSHFFRGVAASSLGNHREAVTYLQKAVLLDPKVSEAYLFLGQSQAELGDAAAAEKNLRRSIALSKGIEKGDVQVRRAHFLLGRLLLKIGRKAEGEAELAKTRAMQGQIFEQARDEIRKIFGEVVSTRSDRSPAGIADVKPNTAPKQSTAAASKVKSGLGEILARAFNNLGVISIQQGNFQDGLEKFTAAAEWKPDLPGLDRNRGIVHFRLSQFDKAIAPLDRQLKTAPADELVRRMLGVSLYLSKNYRQAAATLAPIEAKLTADAELAYFYGISLVQSDKHQDAGALFSRLVEQNQANAQARFYGAQGFIFLGNYERALQEFRAVSALDPRMLQVHYNAGQALIRLNRLDEAENEFRRELALNSADETAKYHLAFTLLERKIKTEEAMDLLNDAIAARPDYADALYQLGKAFLEKGELEKAIDHLERAARSDAKKDYTHYQLSIAYRRASRTADADRALKVYRELKAANRQPGSLSAN
jgi:tetratricopeptide (TPR) repeat protein